MPRTYWRGAVVSYAFCQPSMCDLAVPVSPQNLPGIMGNYPLPWVRASNANCFSGGTAEGVMAERGTVYPSLVVPGRPLLILSGDTAWFSYDSSEARDASTAVGAGPMLVSGGQRTDVLGLIYQGRFTGLEPEIPRPRAAVGITQGGIILHVIAISLSLTDLADFMIEQGATAAMNLDGGESTGLMENGQHVLGYQKRPLPSALVLRELMEPPVQGSGARTVMLDPGHGEPDTGAMGLKGLIEADIVLDICQRTRPFLERSGLRVVLSRDSRKGLPIDERVGRCNRESVYGYVMLHANWAGTPSAEGAESYYWYSSQNGRRLAESLLASVTRFTSLERRPYTPKPVYAGRTGYYQALRLTNPPAAILECGFLTNPFDAAYLSDFVNRNIVAQAIAQGIMEWVR